MSETPNKVARTEAEWRAILTPEQYMILREKATERAFTGALTQNHETGNYHCAGAVRCCLTAGPSSTPAAGGPAHVAGQLEGYCRA